MDVDISTNLTFIFPPDAERWSDAPICEHFLHREDDISRETA